MLGPDAAFLKRFLGKSAAGTKTGHSYGKAMGNSLGVLSKVGWGVVLRESLGQSKQ